MILFSQKIDEELFLCTVCPFLPNLCQTTILLSSNIKHNLVLYIMRFKFRIVSRDSQSLISHSSVAHQSLISRSSFAHQSLIICSSFAHQSLISRSSVAHQSLISRSSVAHQSLISCSSVTQITTFKHFSLVFEKIKLFTIPD